MPDISWFSYLPEQIATFLLKKSHNLFHTKLQQILVKRTEETGKLYVSKDGAGIGLFEFLHNSDFQN